MTHSAMLLLAFEEAHLVIVLTLLLPLPERLPFLSTMRWWPPGQGSAHDWRHISIRDIPCPYPPNVFGVLVIIGTSCLCDLRHPHSSQHSCPSSKLCEPCFKARTRCIRDTNLHLCLALFPQKRSSLEGLFSFRGVCCDFLTFLLSTFPSHPHTDRRKHVNRYLDT